MADDPVATAALPVCSRCQRKIITFDGSRPTICGDCQPATTAWPYSALYFGCWQSTGHRYCSPGMGSANYKTRSSELTPWGDGIDGRFTPKSTSKQGAALLTHDQGWTVLSIHDYTVDKRGNSHSTFAFVGTLDYDEAVAAATEHFPEVMRRLGAIERVDR